MTVSSRLNDVLRVKDNLPQDQKDLFNKLFVSPVKTEVLCRNLAITQEELTRRKRLMMRTLMRAI